MDARMCGLPSRKNNLPRLVALQLQSVDEQGQSMWWVLLTFAGFRESVQKHERKK